MNVWAGVAFGRRGGLSIEFVIVLAASRVLASHRPGEDLSHTDGSVRAIGDGQSHDRLQTRSLLRSNHFWARAETVAGNMWAREARGCCGGSTFYIKSRISKDWRDLSSKWSKASSLYPLSKKNYWGSSWSTFSHALLLRTTPETRRTYL